MEVAIPITLEGVRYPSKASIEDYVNYIIRTSPANRDLPEHDFQFVESLYLRHPMAKNLPPIWEIQVLPYQCSKCSRRYYDPCFLMKCSNGMRFCFSHHQALYPIPGAEPLRIACRAAIWKQIMRKKCELQDPTTKTFTCSIEGISLVWGQVEMDHAAPNTLEQLVWDWLWSKGLYVDDVPLEVTYQRGRKQYTIKDEYLLGSWRQFHSRHARIRPLCRHAHKRVSKLWYERREVVETQTWSVKTSSAPVRPITREQRVRRGFRKRGV